MKRIVLIIFLLLPVVTLSQTIHYITAGTGISYSKLTYITDFVSGRRYIRGLDNGIQFGLGISSLRSSVLGAEVLFSAFKMPARDHDFFESRQQTKMSYKLFSRFDIFKNYSIKPYIALNYYKNAVFIIENDAFSMEYGASIIKRKNRVFYELQISSFPEFDFLVTYSDVENFYRISALHLPYIAFNINILLDDIEGLNQLNQRRKEYYDSLIRHFRIESGIVQLAYGYGISYQFKYKKDERLRFDIGNRTGFTHHPFNSFLFNSYLYFAPNYNLSKSKKMEYFLNAGGEAGGGLIFISGSNYGDWFPYPHLMLFLENEFKRFYIRIGAGTGFYGVVGYKLL